MTLGRQYLPIISREVAGMLLALGRSAATVRRRLGRLRRQRARVTDGPFAEPTEVVGRLLDHYMFWRQARPVSNQRPLRNSMGSSVIC
jgi:hypothetical protein